jgi:hypothetical protein
MNLHHHPQIGVIRPRPYWAVLRYDGGAAEATMHITGRARWRGSGASRGSATQGSAGSTPIWTGSPLPAAAAKGTITRRESNGANERDRPSQAPNIRRSPRSSSECTERVPRSTGRTSAGVDDCRVKTRFTTKAGSILFPHPTLRRLQMSLHLVWEHCVGYCYEFGGGVMLRGRGCPA